jgi:hypothetical protein
VTPAAGRKVPDRTFDPKRQAILLVAGDKAGKWTSWYKRSIPLADDRFDEHVDQLRREGQ